jgi:hypothetical protein
MSWSSSLVASTKLLPVTAPDVFSAPEEMCVAIVVKKSESDVNVFRVALNTCDQNIYLKVIYINRVEPDYLTLIQELKGLEQPS